MDISILESICPLLSSEILATRPLKEVRSFHPFLYANCNRAWLRYGSYIHLPSKKRNALYDLLLCTSRNQSRLFKKRLHRSIRITHKARHSHKRIGTKNRSHDYSHYKKANKLRIWTPMIHILRLSNDEHEDRMK